MRADVLDPDLIVDIKKIKETRAVTEEKGGWRIGAAVTGAELKEHARLRKAWPGVVEAANLIGSTQGQGRAALGGNLCNRSPAGGRVPALLPARGGGRLPSHRREAGHRGVPSPGRGRAGTPGGPDRAGPGEEQQLMAKQHIEAAVNGDAVEFLWETEETLLDVLRDSLNLTGSKEGCASGDCGACSVMLDGPLGCSSLVLGCEVAGSKGETIEGMAKGESLHPLQQQFLKSAALQCGICTPGVLVASKALLERSPDPTETEVRYWLAGNLCRGTGYDKIVSAVMGAGAELGKGYD